MRSTEQQKKTRPPPCQCGRAPSACGACSCTTWRSWPASACTSTRSATSSASLISADLWVRDDYDGVSDRLADVLDYGKVMADIITLAQSEHVNLNETLAERIAQQCLTDPRVEGVRVHIAKPDVTHSCKSVGIEIERWRGGVAGQV